MLRATWLNFLLRKREDEIRLLKASNDDLVAMVTRGAFTLNPDYHSGEEQAAPPSRDAKRLTLRNGSL